MEQRNNKGLVWLIVILILLVLGLGGYIIYDKFLPITFGAKIEKDNITTTSQKVEQTDQIDLKEIAQTLFKKIDNTGLGSIEWNFNDNKIITYDNMNDENIYELIWNDLYLNKKIKSIDGDNDGYYDNIEDDYQIIKLSDFKISLESVFGEDKIETFNYKNEFFGRENLYKLENNQYKGKLAIYDSYEETRYYLNSYEKDGDNFYLYVSHVYVESCDGEKTECDIYYKDSSRNNLLFQGDSNLQYNKEKLGIYKFTFNLENNNYIFKSVEEV